YLGKDLKLKNQKLIKVCLTLIAIFITIALIFSFSLWAIILFIIIGFIIALYQLLPPKHFAKVFYPLLLISLLFGGLHLFTTTEYNLRIDIWETIITIMFAHLPANISTGVISTELKNTAFGYGFDTLGH